MKNKLTFIFAIVIILVISSCSKNEKLNITKSKYLEFTSIEEYNNTLTQIINMSEDERLVWEKEQDFVSFATIANSKYEAIAKKRLTIEELKKEVENEKNYLVIKEDREDYILETTLESSLKQFIINKDRVYKIGDDYYKVFQNDVIICSEEEFPTLLTLTENNYTSYIGEKFKSSNNPSLLKDDIYKVPMHSIYISGYDERYLIERRDTDGRHRIRNRIMMDFTIKFIPNGGGAYYNYPKLWAEAKPYIRILGIWYTTKRDVSCDYKIKYDCNFHGPWIRSKTYGASGSIDNSGGLLYLIRDFGRTPLNYSPSLYMSHWHLACSNSWAKSDKTGKAEINYNTELF